MTTRANPRSAAQAAILAVLAFVLLLRTLVPAGYMIAPSGGWPVLTLCEAAAPIAPAGHEGHDAPAEPKQPCAYAALASPVLPPAPPTISLPPSPPEAALPGRVQRDPYRPAPASLPPPSTGPPHRV